MQVAKINLLDKHVAELIAAGEVVERPASVIKELVENSIDAGASTVTVEVKNGGVSYIRVTDNGCGIAREDVPVAFLRHATSKVAVSDDLDAIATLGFRGEALASVAAVSHVELLTRTAEELAGTRYVIEGGDEQECGDAGCAEGTTIIVRDMFFNTPARMKFLKKDTVEANAVASVLDRIALSHPEVSLRFVREGKETLHTPGDGKLKSAIFAVFGKEFTSGLLPVEYEFNGVSVSGYLTKPSAARPNRSMQHFFINGRCIKSRTAMVAMEEGCKGSLMVGKFPACVLHLSLSCEAVDVNVHPAKLEVRFINERPIFDAVYHAVKTALNKGDSPSVMSLPKILDETPPKPFVPAIVPPVQPPVPVKTVEQIIQGELPSKFRPIPELHDSVVRPNRQEDIDISFPTTPAYHGVKSPEPKIEPEPPALIVQETLLSPEPVVQETLLPAAPAEEARLVGEAFGTYILLERGNELVFIDKHAAHERMLYEQLKAQSGTAFSQLLLEPVAVTLDKSEYAAVLENLETCAQAGFEIDDFGAGSVLVRSAPLSLAEDVAGAVMEIAGYLAASKTDVTTDRLDWLYHNIACRAAVKAHDESTPQELADLARRLEENPDIRYCPHGRPVSIVMKKRDLEKQFGRIQ